MFLFLKFYLSHLIGDYVLQFDELYALKVKSPLGHFFHILIHFLLAAIFVIPYWTEPLIWLFIVVLSFVHWLQDLVKYRVQQESSKKFIAHLIDQLVHLTVIASVVLLPMSNEVRSISTDSLLNDLYTNNTWTLIAILFFLSTFAGAYMMHAFRASYVPASRPDHGITAQELGFGILERGLISLAIVFSPSILLSLPTLGIGFLRLSRPLLKDRLDFLMSALWALGWGLVFRNWIRIV